MPQYEETPESRELTGHGFESLDEIENSVDGLIRCGFEDVAVSRR